MLDVIPGVWMYLSRGKQKLTVEEDGYVGQLVPEDPLFLHALVQPDFDHVHVVSIQNKEKRIIVPYQNVSLSGGRHYHQRIFLDRGKEAYMVSRSIPPMYGMVTGKSGKIEMYAVALFTQGETNFLTSQKIWETECYRNGHGVALPNVTPAWPALVQFLEQYYAKSSGLPAIETYVKSTVAIPSLRQKEGSVLWYNDYQGSGAIATLQGELLVKWKEVQPRPRKRYLRAGERVRYKSMRMLEVDSLKAKKNKWHNKEALGVSVLPS